MRTSRFGPVDLSAPVFAAGELRPVIVDAALCVGRVKASGSFVIVFSGGESTALAVNPKEPLRGATTR